MRIAALILATMLAACSSPAPPADYAVLNRIGPLVFILVNPSMPRNAEAWRLAVREACGDAHICNAKIWTDPTRAAQGFPMTALEVNAIEAAYLINRSTGHDGFICHPFGEAGKRCA